MAELRYNISQLTNQLFGMSDLLIRYNASGEESKAYAMNFPGAKAVTINEENVTSHLGTPVAFPIKFKGGNYNIYENGEVVQKRMDDLMLPFTTIADFRRAKIINHTKINGGQGTVKEVYGHDDWKIRLRGLILKSETFTEDGTTTAFPENMLLSLKAYDDLVESVSVSGKMFEMLGIYRINIVEINFLQVKGAPNVRPFEIICESDEPLELII